jgi:hypothetical protein
MGTRFDMELAYDASAEEVGAMLDDPAFRERVCDAQGAISKTVTITQDGDVQTVVIDQTQPNDDLPGFARKFVGETIQLVQTERWTDSHNAEVEVVIPGKPGQMTGRAYLAEDGGTTTEHIEMVIQVNIPVVGGKLEKLIADLLRKALKQEHAVGKDYLSG